MATRSTISIENRDGRVFSIYCHWDGYLSNNGRTLYGYYQDEEKIHDLMKLGDLSSLAMDIGFKHSFDHTPNDQCSVYGRDRDETSVNHRIYDDLPTFLSQGSFEEYNYLWRAGEWWVDLAGVDDCPFASVSEWSKLASALDKEDEED